MNYLIWGLKKSGLASLNLLQKVNFSKKNQKNNDFDNYFLFDDNEKTRTNLKIENNENVFILDKLTKKTIKKMNKIVISPAISINNPLLNFARNNNIDVVGELELAYQNMDKSCTLVAITGTNGKTTTTELVYQILQKAGKKSEKVGNIGLPFSSMVGNGEKNVLYVCETSSFQLESCKIFHPHIACLINLSPDHLDRHKDMTTYSNIKKLIFLNQNKKDFAIVPAGLNVETNANIFHFGTKKRVKRGIFVKKNEIFIKKSIFCHKVCNLKDINFFGEQYVEDVLCAVMIAKLLGVKNKFIRQVLQNFTPSAHRLQLVYLSGDGNKFFDDSKATNVDATIKAMKAFDSPTILLCGGSDKNCNYDDLFLYLPKNVEKIYVFGDTADKILISHKKSMSNVSIEKCDSLRQAVYLACQEKNKIILLSPACASFDEFSSYKERGEKFLEYIKDYYEKF